MKRNIQQAEIKEACSVVSEVLYLRPCASASFDLEAETSSTSLKTFHFTAERNRRCGKGEAQMGTDCGCT